ncbi:MAG: hypothetical protein KXJ49_06905 [Vulcanococcus sp.]|uniref:phosphotransferase n=1 Tax=Vulcanococcus sp. TaxID=2856995 RepID=UPI0025F2558F|nr:phosphotransferase [Vulcanococcus sp.]MBW0167208.1 hypothetical protein [Vulcanococcus sp.]
MAASTTVLILAAGQLPERQLGPAPLLHRHPLDLPAGSDLALQRISAHYRRHWPQAQLVAVIDAASRSHYPAALHQLDQLLTITPQPSINASLEAALQRIDAHEVVVNPITALPTATALPNCAVVLGDEALPRQNWSAFATPQPRGPSQLLSKLQPNQANEPASYPFTGLLSAPRATLLELLAQLSTNQRSDLAWTAALLLEQHHAQVVHTPWHDLGHRATYARSRRSQLVSRSHNRVVYDPAGDLISKRSSDLERLNAEATYLQTLPPRLRRHFPALLGLSEQQGLELEYVPFPSLAELYLHWQIGPEGWAGIWSRLAQILNELSNSSPAVIASCNWLYSHKLRQRLHQLDQQPPSPNWYQFWQQPLELNGRRLPSPAACAQATLAALAPLEASRPLQRIHGDLCFNNVLAEPLHAAVRLIDPRGEAAPDSDVPVGYGDPRYDLVKLLHSGCYGYDLAVHGLFTLTGDPARGWQARLYPPRQAEQVAAQLDGFVRSQGLTPEEERWLTASLFFSMLPLHSDSLQRQQMLTLIGCCISQQTFDLLLPCVAPSL